MKPEKIIEIGVAWLFVLLLFFSSVVINIIQLLSLIAIMVPIRDRLKLNQTLSNLWWELWCFIQESYMHIPFRFTGDAIHSSENALLIGNHNAGLDFPVGVSVLSRAPGVGCGRMMTMMKFVLQFVPMVGWTHRLQGSLFLNRNWEKDQHMIHAKLADMEEGRFPRPFWIGVYPEGTRITPEKKRLSLKFAGDQNLPLLQNVLLPRTKGFLTIVKNLPTAMTVIYDTTIAYSTREMFLGDILLGGRYKTTAVHVHVRRYEWSSLPKEEADLSKWLVDRFVEKDQLLQDFAKIGHFPGETPSSYEAPHHRFISIFAGWSLILSVFWALYSGVGLIWLAINALAAYAIYEATRTKTVIPPPSHFEALAAAHAAKVEAASKDKDQ